MTDNVVLVVPKRNCRDIDFKGVPSIMIELDMTAEEMIMALLRHSATGESVVAIRSDKDD